ncbi:hypothetical protein E3N88_00136 [Mikania micrantha]|uniref:DNA-directed RNA polymerase n=1 Tax=Mikania micrantha TaxID=192012 RepID=A0A5N6PZY8_9ASTR|nr:hypothetical protein E3N88_00136 [Mikania micrantha]
MKRLISRFIDHYGIGYTSHIIDQVKTLGFRQATVASISLGIDNLLTIPSKRWLVQDAEQQSFILEKHPHYGNVQTVEKLRQSIKIWYATSEHLRQEMTPDFQIIDHFNPVHIMSFSRDRGNASQWEWTKSPTSQEEWREIGSLMNILAMVKTNQEEDKCEWKNDWGCICCKRGEERYSKGVFIVTNGGEDIFLE